jgi:hypothetical protein
MRKLMLLAAAFAAMLPCQAVARGRIGVFVGPAFVPYGGYVGWYGPYFYGPYGYAPYAAVPNAGQVKLDTKVKDAQVFVDGSYAGTVGQLKTMTLRPGSYTIEIQAPGRARYAEKIYVVAGKRITLNPDLHPVPAS